MQAADSHNRVYEDLMDFNKVKNVLKDVSISNTYVVHSYNNFPII